MSDVIRLTPWLGRCDGCRRLHLYTNGAALFRLDHSLQGWHGYFCMTGPGAVSFDVHGTYITGVSCHFGCLQEGTTYPVQVTPVTWDEQQAWLGAYQVGGEAAVRAMLNAETGVDDSYIRVKQLRKSRACG